jgi:hypothetical protein
MFARQWETLFLELIDLGYRPGTPRLSGPFAICPADLVGPRETERAEGTDAVEDSAADIEMSRDAAY